MPVYLEAFVDRANRAGLHVYVPCRRAAGRWRHIQINRQAHSTRTGAEHPTEGTTTFGTVKLQRTSEILSRDFYWLLGYLFFIFICHYSCIRTLHSVDNDDVVTDSRPTVLFSINDRKQLVAPPALSFSDQFAYRPTGSTTALQPSSLFFTQLLSSLHPTHMS